MRRRLFWMIAGVAAITGLLVLVGALVAQRRAAIDATYREMKQSSDEAVAILEEAVGRVDSRPGLTRELIAALEGEEVVPLLGRIRRTAGGSEIGFGLLAPDGELRTDSDLLRRVSIEHGRLGRGLSQFTRSELGELVVVTPGELQVGDRQVGLVVGLAREAPVISPGDQLPLLLAIGAATLLLAGLAARLLSSQLTKRLEPLAEASHRMARGEADTRVPDPGLPELDAVARAFNEMAADLQQSRAREREFLLGVGHDLRTPLTTIAGYAEALESGEIEPADVERVGSVLGAQSRQMSRLIEDLSLLARLAQPEFTVRTEEVDVGLHVTEIVDGFGRVAEAANVGLVVDAPQGTVVATDPDRLGQIAQNLVENALRFTPETGTVRVEVSPAGDGAEIVVSDTGVGIHEEDLPRIFDRDFSASQRVVRHEGSGLGLSIVDGLVRRLGGTVTATSQPGRGTTVRVWLPGEVDG